MISAVVVSFNEQDKLNDCLQSVENFAKELVVVDLGSQDKSVEVAQKYRAKIYYHPQVSFVEAIRNWAITKTSGEWVLVMDPDEKLSQPLISKLKEIVKEGHYSAVNIPRQNIFFGTWIAHSNFWPDRHVRFFKKGAVDWPQKIHSYPQVAGPVLNLPAQKDLAIVHLGYDHLIDFIIRQLRYAQVEAQNRIEEKKYFSIWNLIWQPSREFLVRFVKHQGFLDGFDGFYIVVVLMVYRVMVEIKVLKLQLKR